MRREQKRDNVVPYLQEIRFCPHCSSTQWGVRLLYDALWRCRKCEREIPGRYPPVGAEYLQARELRKRVVKPAQVCKEEQERATKAAEDRLGEPWVTHEQRLEIERKKGRPPGPNFGG